MNKYKYKKHTPEEVQKLIERYEQGETLREIGESVDLSRERIRQIFEKANYNRRPNTVSKKLIESYASREKHLPRTELERLYVDEKKCAREIAEIFDSNDSLIYVNLERYNIPRRSLSETNKFNSLIYYELTRENLYRWYIEERKTAETIAREVGCQLITVYKKLKAFEIRKSKPYKPRKR